MNKEVKTLIALLIGSILLMTFGPFTVHEHYVFGIMAVGLVLLTRASKKVQVVLVALTFLWGLSIKFSRSVIQTSDRLACVKQVCALYPQPIYVVTNGTSHDHQGLGYAYLAQKNGCDLFAVTQWKNQTPATMVVMNESTTFDPEHTDFYELNRFGSRFFVEELACGQNLTATVFK